VIRVLLDTNIILVITPYFSAYRWVYDALCEGQFELVVSTEMLNEYAELPERHYSADFAERTLLALDNIESVVRVEPPYRFRMIQDDPDDRNAGPH